MRLSIVIPVLDEEPVIAPLCRRLIDVLSPLTSDFEILFVDDGSADGTLAVLMEERRKDQRVKILSLSRCFGHQAALTAGLDYADGDAVITMDGDLQHPPEVIPELVQRWKEGYQVVHTLRNPEGGTFWKSFFSTFFYRVFQALSGVPLPSHAADFRLMDRRVVDALRRFPERTRFLRGLVSWAGYRSTGVTYTAAPRFAGESRYRPTRMLTLGIDALLSFSTVPLKAVVGLGFFLGLMTTVYSVYILDAFLRDRALPGWTSVTLLISWIGTCQLLVTGIVGLYLGKVYEEIKRRPSYLAREAHGLTLKP